MEVERAPSADFEEEVLKPPEVKEDRSGEIVDSTKETKEIAEIDMVEPEEHANGKDNGNHTVEGDEDKKVVLNGSENILNGDDEGLHSEEIKKEEEITCEEKVNGDITMDTSEVKEDHDEPMDHDTSREIDPTPEPPEPPEDKGPKLEKPIFDENIVDGFSFCSFDTFAEVEVSLDTSWQILLTF